MTDLATIKGQKYMPKNSVQERSSQRAREVLYTRVYTESKVAHENIVDSNDFVANVDLCARFSSTTRHEPLHEHLDEGEPHHKVA